jgi:hypothetical protein
MAECVDSYRIAGSTLLHQPCMVGLLEEGLGEHRGGHQRSLVGGMAERSSSTIEIPDIDINARFHLDTEWIQVSKSEKFGSFLYEIQVVVKEEVDRMVLMMQYHGMEQEPVQKEKGLDKSYVKREEGTFLSSNVARWQLIGVIKAMQSWGLEMSQASRVAADTGLLNGVYHVRVYDSSVCRRGILKGARLRKVLEAKLKHMKTTSDLEEMMDLGLCFHPETGIQVDYTAGFHISEEAVPEEAKSWALTKAKWPSADLRRRVLSKGAHLVPKAFTEEKGHKNVKARRWRINFDLNEIICDKEYSKKIDARSVLIILKDIKNGILPQSSRLIKSYFLKVAISR